jgi:hypothetical protein
MPICSSCIFAHIHFCWRALSSGPAVKVVLGWQWASLLVSLPRLSTEISQYIALQLIHFSTEAFLTSSCTDRNTLVGFSDVAALTVNFITVCSAFFDIQLSLAGD